MYKVMDDRQSRLNSMTRDLQGITKNGGGCDLVGFANIELTKFFTLWPVLLRFARNNLVSKWGANETEKQMRGRRTGICHSDRLHS